MEEVASTEVAASLVASRRAPYIRNSKDAGCSLLAKWLIVRDGGLPSDVCF